MTNPVPDKDEASFLATMDLLEQSKRRPSAGPRLVAAPVPRDRVGPLGPQRTIPVGPVTLALARARVNEVVEMARAEHGYPPEMAARIGLSIEWVIPAPPTPPAAEVPNAES